MIAGPPEALISSTGSGGQIGYTWNGARGGRVTMDRSDVMEGRLELGLERWPGFVSVGQWEGLCLEDWRQKRLPVTWLLYLPRNFLDRDEQVSANCVLLWNVVVEFWGVVIGMNNSSLPHQISWRNSFLVCLTATERSVSTFLGEARGQRDTLTTPPVECWQQELNRYRSPSL